MSTRLTGLFSVAMRRGVYRSRRRSRARDAWQRIENLEAKVMLSAAGTVDDLNSALSGVGHVPGFPELTTTGSDAPIFLAGEPVDWPLGAETAQSSPLIDLDLFRADPRFAGIDGSGGAVVILDTGIDLNHPFFGPDGDSNGIADRIVHQFDFADGDANATDVNGHGSNVASISLSEDTTHRGMAPGADIIALKVFSDSGAGSFAVLESALQWVVANAATFNIVSINMSLSDSLNHSTPQMLYGIGDELAALTAQGVVVVSAAGNSFAGFGSAQGVGYPAADPNSLAVSAVYDANVGPRFWSGGASDFTTGPDRVTSFSQRSTSLTDIMAPGAMITGASATGGTVTFGGTSQASPHIAGIVALAQQLAQQELGRKLTPAEFRTILTSSADTIFDGDDEDDNVTNTNASFPRVNVLKLGDAILNLGGGGGGGPVTGLRPGDVYYATDAETNNLLMVDDTATVTVVGPLGLTPLLESIGGLAWDPANNILYGLDGGSESLYQIDTSTGAAQLLTSIDLDLSHGLTFNPTDGQLYTVLNEPNAELVRIDPVNLTAEVLVGTTAGVGVSGLTHQVHDGRIYLTRNGSPRVVSVNDTSFGDLQFHANPVTFPANEPFFGMTYDGRNLILAGGPETDENLHEYNPLTGLITPLLAVDKFDGMLIDAVVFAGIIPPPHSRELIGIDFGAGGTSSPTNWSLFSQTGDGTLTDLIDETGASTPIDLTVDVGDDALDYAAYVPLPGQLPQHTQPLAGIDGNLHDESLVTLTFSDLIPGTLYEVYLFGGDVTANQQSVSIVGATTSNFVQNYAADTLLVNGQEGVAGQSLQSFSRLVAADVDGQIKIVVDNIGTALGIAGAAVREAQSALHGTKFQDLNSNGRRDPGEPGLPGWTIYLDLNDNDALDTVDGLVAEVEPNNTLATAQTLNNQSWSLQDVSTINNADARPHLTIPGTGDGTFDYYSFTIDTAGTVATFDLDATNFDTELFLYTAAGQLLLANDDSSLDPGSTSNLDSFITHTFTAPGTYVIGVGEFDSQGSIGGITGDAPDPGDFYTLHISIDGKPIAYAEPFTVSDSSGAYWFTDLAPGDYIVREVVQPGWEQVAAPHHRATKVVITEVDMSTTDFVEIQNTSVGAVSTAGWFLAASGSTTNINTPLSTVYTLPASLAANQVLYATDSTTDNFFGANLPWTNGTPGWALLSDATGKVVDFVAWGWTEAQLASFNVTVGGFTFSGLASSWTGPATPVVSSTTSSLQRIGDSDTNSRADFVAGTPVSKGTQNTGLVTPFVGYVENSSPPPSGGGAPSTAGSVAGLVPADSRPFSQSEVIVALKPGVSLAAAQSLLAIPSPETAGLIASVTLDSGRELLRGAESTLVEIPLAKGADPLKVVASFSQLGFVAWASPNFLYAGPDPRELTPNDPQYGSQYHHPLMQNNLAWDITTGSPTIIVAVTDDGVETTHPDLNDNLWINTGEIAGNGLDDDNNGYIDDVNGWDFAHANNNPNPDQLSDDHGTHVAGIIGAEFNNAIGVVGTAPGTRLMALQFYDQANPGLWTSARIAETYRYATDNGAKIISTSYNIDGWVGDPTFTAGVQYAYDGGVLHFNSAGNNNQLNPARQVFEQLLFVASTTSTDTRSGFSNYGIGIDVAAPGSSILSTITNGGFGSKSGTSMSTPNAAAVAALIWSANPTWTRDQVAAQLLGTADNIDAQNPSFVGLLGSGRVNSFKALSQTLAPPQIRSVAGLTNGQVLVNPLTELEVILDDIFDEASIENVANWRLVGDGPDNVFGTTDDILVPLSVRTSYMVGTNRLFLDVNGVLVSDTYQFRGVAGGLQNPFGTALDGNRDGTAGDDFVLQLVVPQVAAGHAITVLPGQVITHLDFGNRELFPSPRVVTWSLNGGSGNYSGAANISLIFDQGVSLTGATSLRLRNHTTAQTIDLSTATLIDNGTSTVQWNLVGITLPDGRYTVELPANEAQNIVGRQLERTFAAEFHVRRGDVNGDGAVNFADFSQVGAHFDPIAGVRFRPGDADGDGAVNFADFSVIGAAFSPAVMASLQLDFGDAAQTGTSFKTTLANDGARHVLGSGLLLGTLVDSEADGQPTVGADGEGSDDDGVTFSALQAGTTGMVTVSAVVPGVGFLNAWIDFNGNGNWSDPGEQILDDVSITTGSSPFMIAVPATASAMATARFRLTSAPGYDHFGLATAGEVEDYVVAIAPPPPPPPAGGDVTSPGKRRSTTSRDVSSLIVLPAVERVRLPAVTGQNGTTAADSSGGSSSRGAGSSWERRWRSTGDA
jgi:subtilisin family serine protease